MATQRPNKQADKDTKSGNEDAACLYTSSKAQSQPFERKIITINAIKTVIGLGAAAAVVYLYVPIPIPSLPTAGHRLVYTLRLQTPAFLILMAAILNVGMVRLHTPAINPIYGNAEHLVEFERRFLANHVEQMLLNVPGQLVLVSFLGEGHMKVIPILSLIFVFGRVSFYIGYRMSYLRRTVGFMSSFLPSCLIWLVNAYFVGRALVHNETIKL
ncbi:transmembrane protein 79 [Elysia marginata]|uniref:Transmembrane protein 79 n=1 Tax=Elysia marginata TaxID=1093978 RepID=A0AAV4HKY5_9GAST|nr:transmembrane protein 79 [Elysia marginata]